MPTAHWGVPLALMATTSRQRGGVLVTEPPMILFQVSSVDWLGRHRVEGFGFARLPAKAGSIDTEARLLERAHCPWHHHDCAGRCQGQSPCVEARWRRAPDVQAPRSCRQVTTWRPCGSSQSQLVDFFVGGAHRLKDLRFAAHPPRTEADASHKRRFLSRFGFATQASGGRVRVRAHAVEQLPPPARSARPTPKVRSSSHHFDRARPRRVLTCALVLAHPCRQGGAARRVGTRRLEQPRIRYALCSCAPATSDFRPWCAASRRPPLAPGPLRPGCHRAAPWSRWRNSRAIPRQRRRRRTSGSCR